MANRKFGTAKTIYSAKFYGSLCSIDINVEKSHLRLEIMSSEDLRVFRTEMKRKYVCTILRNCQTFFWKF
jgi:hypothetical protein